MSVSLSDVAQRAGVSRGAVSQVINGDVRDRISAPTKERIFAAMSELGYQPNLMARALSRGKTNTIGLMLSGFRNPFYVSLLENTERLLAEAGYRVLLDSSSLMLGNASHGMPHVEVKDELQCGSKLRGWNVDGVLMYTPPHQEITQYLGATARDLPQVRMGTTSGPGDWVVFDIYDGARQAIEYVVSRGYTKIATATPYTSSTRREQMEGRLAACFDVCEKAGLSLELISISGEEEVVGGRRAGEEIARRPPKTRPHVVLCHNDALAIGLYHGLRRGGARVPEDVAVVGFDGIREGQLLDKPLTTVEMPTLEMCRSCIELLLSRIAQKCIAQNQKNRAAPLSSTRNGSSSTRRAEQSELVKSPSQTIVVPTRLLIGETA